MYWKMGIWWRFTRNCSAFRVPGSELFLKAIHPLHSKFETQNSKFGIPKLQIE